MDLHGLQLTNWAYALGVFDLDGNLLEMPTKHYYQHKVSKDVVEILWHEVDQDPDRFLWPEAEYEYVEGNKAISYRNYQDTCFSSDYEHRWPEWFLEDIRTALTQQSRLTPPMQLMKHTFLIPGRMMSINTARGHSPETLMRGLKIINNWILTNREQEEQIENIRRNYNISKETTDEWTLEYYLRKVVNYIPWDNADVQKHLWLDAKTRDMRKVQWLRWNIWYIRRQLAEIMQKPIKEVLSRETPLAVWFSDDGASNIKTLWAQILSVPSLAQDPLHKFRLYYTGPARHVDSIVQHIWEWALYTTYSDSPQVWSTKLRIQPNIDNDNFLLSD